MYGEDGLIPVERSAHTHLHAPSARPETFCLLCLRPDAPSSASASASSPVSAPAPHCGAAPAPASACPHFPHPACAHYAWSARLLCPICRTPAGCPQPRAPRPRRPRRGAQQTNHAEKKDADDKHDAAEDSVAALAPRLSASRVTATRRARARTPPPPRRAEWTLHAASLPTHATDAPEETRTPAGSEETAHAVSSRPPPPPPAPSPAPPAHAPPPRALARRRTWARTRTRSQRLSTRYSSASLLAPLDPPSRTGTGRFDPGAVGHEMCSGGGGGGRDDARAAMPHLAPPLFLLSWRTPREARARVPGLAPCRLCARPLGFAQYGLHLCADWKMHRVHTRCAVDAVHGRRVCRKCCE